MSRWHPIASCMFCCCFCKASAAMCSSSLTCMPVISLAQSSTLVTGITSLAAPSADVKAGVLHHHAMLKIHLCEVYAMCRGWQAVTLDHVTSWHECLIKQVRVCGPGCTAAGTDRVVQQINSAVVADDTEGQLPSQYAYRKGVHYSGNAHTHALVCDLHCCCSISFV